MESKNYVIEKIGKTPTGVPVYMIIGVTLDDILESMTNKFSPLHGKIRELELEFSKGKGVIYRSFDPTRFQSVILNGTDRTPDYISPADKYKSDVIYAGSLWKALEYAMKHFNKYSLACISVYDEGGLEKTDFYAYRAKTSFNDALLGIICLSDSEYGYLYKDMLLSTLQLLQYTNVLNDSKRIY